MNRGVVGCGRSYKIVETTPNCDKKVTTQKAYCMYLYCD